MKKPLIIFLLLSFAALIGRPLVVNAFRSSEATRRTSQATRELDASLAKIKAADEQRSQVEPDVQAQIDALKAKSSEAIADSQAMRAEAGTTLSEYEQIASGMTQAEVESILGKGEEISRVGIEGTPKTVMYQWTNADGGNMNVTLQGGEVVQKAQFGLK
ncbi:MAG: hypothetical protein AAF152_12285 [Cyanobacteria bacterium P01_A01_bin.114]